MSEAIGVLWNLLPTASSTVALRVAESNEDAAIGAMSHISGSPTGSTETMSEAIGVYGMTRSS